MKTVFLDRDGVINVNRPEHVTRWEEFHFLPGALRGLQLLNRGGWRVIVVTNQAVINREIVSQATVEEINQHMVEEIRKQGGRIDSVLVCPHRPDEGCSCRKPRPGLLHQAAERWGLELEQSFLVGDALTDIEAGLAVGCECLLVQTGRGRQELERSRNLNAGTFHLAADLLMAVRMISLLEERRRTGAMWKSSVAAPLPIH
jgi:D-glycero-D-manno-heptose 1,7-bisphosphate phosphatase